MLVLFGLASNEEFHVSSRWKGIVQCSIYGLEGGGVWEAARVHHSPHRKRETLLFISL